MDTATISPSPNGAVPAVVGDIVTSLSLPSGGTAVLRDPRELRAGDKRRVIRSITNSDNLRARSLDVVEGVLCMLVEQWDLPYLPNAPLPKDEPGILDMLNIPDYDALIDATGPAVGLLFPQAVPEDANKKGSPTPPAGA